MSNSIKFTIITVVYNLIKANREEKIIRCLNSVHNQTFKNFEHIVIDGASTDGTLDILKKYKRLGWIKLISEPDNGLYDAMNKGIKIATGDYIAFLNSDDYYASDDVLQAEAESFVASKAKYSYGKTLISDVLNKKEHYFNPRIYAFFYKMPFGHPTFFCSKDVLRSVGCFDTQYKLSADYDLICKVIWSGVMGIELEKTIAVFEAGKNLTSTHWNESQHEMMDIIYKNYSSIYSFEKNEVQKIVKRQQLSDNFIEAIRKKVLSAKKSI